MNVMPVGSAYSYNSRNINQKRNSIPFGLTATTGIDAVVGKLRAYNVDTKGIKSLRDLGILDRLSTNVIVKDFPASRTLSRQVMDGGNYIATLVYENGSFSKCNPATS